MTHDWSPQDWEQEKDRQKKEQDGRFGGKRYTKTYAEIAQEMHVAERTVRQWLQTGIPDYRVIRWCEVTGDLPEEVAPHLYPPCCSEVIDGYLERWREN